MPTEREEVVVDADLVESQRIGEQCRDRRFEFGARLPFGSGVELRCRQGTAIEFAVETRRNRVDHENPCGQQVIGHTSDECLTDRHRIHRDTRCRNDISDEHRIACAGRTGRAGGTGLDRRYGTGDTVDGVESRFEFAEFDAQTAQLDLVVAAAEIFEVIAGVPPREVAGA